MSKMQWFSRRFRLKKLMKLWTIFIIVVFLIVKIVEIKFEIHYNALGNLVIAPFSLFGSSEELLINNSWDVLIANLPNNSMARGFPRKVCKCDSLKDLPEEFVRARDTRYASTCSNEASIQPQHQKVISYSLYLRDPNSLHYFLKGMEPNLQKIKSLYTGWRVRIYTDLAVSPYICKFICQFHIVDWCDMRNVPNYGDLTKMDGRSWRFLPIGDPTVEIFISRDLDSMVSVRERLAVTEFQHSQKSIHVIRDSQWHKSEILGGLWGWKNNFLSLQDGIKLRENVINESSRSKVKFWDMDVIRRLIYKPYSDQVLAHDSYYCGKYPDGAVLPFPTQRIGEEFVGHDYRKELNRIFVGRLKECPQQCRPSYGKMWNYC